jgi:NTE family protein
MCRSRARSRPARYYVDGALKKTVHATQALEEGVDLLICLNPLVPFHASPERFGKRHIPTLVEGGFPAVMSQTFRSMIHSRLVMGFKHYETDYPNTDIVLIEPDQRDAELFFANTFSYSQRRQMAEHAYQQTRQTLRERLPTLAPMLERHGISLDHTALNDHRRHLLEPLPSHRQRLATPAVERLNATLDELQRHLPTLNRQAHA